MNKDTIKQALEAAYRELSKKDETLPLAILCIDALAALEAEQQEEAQPSDRRTQVQQALGAMDSLDLPLEGYAAPSASAAPQAQPDNTKVICPACAHQFRAIPVQVQQLMLGLGVEPPFVASPVQPASETDCLNFPLCGCKTPCDVPEDASDAAQEFVRVPKEPTDAMLMAGYHPQLKYAERAEMYRAMIAAALSHQAAHQERDAVDAARYRWLTTSDWHIGPEYSTYNDTVIDGANYNASKAELDAAIDAAMQSASNKEGQ